MKRSLLGVFLFSISCLVSAQTVRIVDNNFNKPTGPLIYDSPQQALDAASPGDVIYIQPSPTAYGDAVVEKENITIYGIGFDLTKDLPYTSVMGDITLINNVENTTNASGFLIEGVQFGDIYMPETRTGSYTFNGATIRNCRFSRWVQNNNELTINDLLIVDCLITGQSLIYRNTVNSIVRNNIFTNNSLSLNFFGGTHQITITNNILYGYIYTNNVSDQVIIDHNNFIGANNTSTYSFQNVITDLVTNNIFYGRSPRASSTNYDNVFNNNLAYGTSDNTLPPAGSGGSGQNTGIDNIVGQNPAFVFVEILSSWSADYDFKLQTGSPAIDAGSDGTDIGITGGGYPWGEIDGKINFQLDTSPLPTIEAFNTTTIINPGDDLPVNVKAKGN